MEVCLRVAGLRKVRCVYIISYQAGVVQKGAVFIEYETACFHSPRPLCVFTEYEIALLYRVRGELIHSNSAMYVQERTPGA